MNELVADFNRAIFLAGAPDQSAEQRDTVVGAATTEKAKSELVEAGVELREESEPSVV